MSGEIRAWSEYINRAKLLDFTWQLRQWLAENGIEHTVGYLETERGHFLDSSDSGSPGASLSETHRQLGEQVEKVKRAKPGADARPTCALFVPCALHAEEYTNYWAPGTDRDGEQRRERASFRARAKFTNWQDGRQHFYNQYLHKPMRRAIEDLLNRKFDRAIVFDDLAKWLDSPTSGEDQYVAYICADGDGLGSLIRNLDWNSARWNGKLLPWERNREFALALQDCIETALAEAIAAASVPFLKNQILKAENREQSFEIPLPVLPQVLGGEDVWLICNRVVALPLAVAFSAKYERIAASNPVLQKSCEVANPNEPLTMSVGLAFAKAGYPANAMVEAAEALLRSAKRLRKGLVDGERRKVGCIDWHWIESSIVEPIDEARERGWSYHDGRERLQLSSRPWTSDEAENFQQAAQQFRGIARRKREQLDDILRRGAILSRLAWRGWWRQLNDDERKRLAEATEMIPLRMRPTISGSAVADPWVETQSGLLTPYLDLVVLAEMGLEASAAIETGNTEVANAEA